MAFSKESEMALLNKLRRNSRKEFNMKPFKNISLLFEKTIEVARLQLEIEALHDQLETLEKGIKDDFFIKYLAKLDEPRRIRTLNNIIAEQNKTIAHLKKQRTALRSDNKKLHEQLKEAKK